MRRIILLSAILLLTGAWAVSQYDSGSDHASNSTTNKVTIQGCLEGAAGNYTLTDYAGASYQLIGNTEALKDHVGATVRITGLGTSIVHVPGAMSEGLETHPTLSVLSFEQVSAICSEPNNIP